MSSLYLLFSHEFTDNQKKDARENLNVNNIKNLPDKLQKLWSNIPPEIEDLTDYLSPLITWLSEKICQGDYILVQGEFGAVFMIVDWAKKNNITAIYSTTERKSKEIKDGDQIKTIKLFEHKRFREYRAWK